MAGNGEILTFSGRYVTPLDLQPEQVCIEDIAHALSNQCRYSGHVREFYSVAEHSIRCAYLAFGSNEPTMTVMQALMHDAAEAYLQDMARPLKEMPEFGQGYREAEQRAEVAICLALKVDYPWADAVKRIDLQMLGAERRDLMPSVGRWEILDGVEYDHIPHIRPMQPKEAESAFLAWYDEIGRKLWKTA